MISLSVCLVIVMLLCLHWRASWFYMTHWHSCVLRWVVEFHVFTWLQVDWCHVTDWLCCWFQKSSQQHAHNSHCALLVSARLRTSQSRVDSVFRRRNLASSHAGMLSSQSTQLLGPSTEASWTDSGQTVHWPMCPAELMILIDLSVAFMLLLLPFSHSLIDWLIDWLSLTNVHKCRQFCHYSMHLICEAKKRGWGCDAGVLGKRPCACGVGRWCR